MSNNRVKRIHVEHKCSCHGYNLDKLLQPNILIILAKHNLHGYLIIQELESKNLFNGEKADATGIYRTLKTLEDRGLVNSEWDVTGVGAAKKIYKITDAGLDCLENWATTLESYKKAIENIIEDAKNILK